MRLNIDVPIDNIPISTSAKPELNHNHRNGFLHEISQLSQYQETKVTNLTYLKYEVIERGSALKKLLVLRCCPNQ